MQYDCLTFNIYKMKKIIAIFFTVFLNLAFYSCTPMTVQEDNHEPVACCGNEGEILPEPPPPPPPPRPNGG
jgi:hypothetical protein